MIALFASHCGVKSITQLGRAGMTTLAKASLLQLPDHVEKSLYRLEPQYQPHKTICHIGVGGFHRAHQALLLDRLIKTDYPKHAEWTICGVGLLPSDKAMQQALSSQDYLYTVIEMSPNETPAKLSVVGAISDYVYAPDDYAQAIERLAAPTTKIASLTITEKGYCLDKNGQLDKDNPDVQHDLAQPQQPRTALMLILSALQLRATRGYTSFTVLSCDNLQENGHLTRRALLQLAHLYDPTDHLAQWIAQNATFPNSMVDRITPATTDDHRTWLHDQFGISDNWPVVCEEYIQWVIEDNFSDGRPAWEKVGAVLTDMQQVRRYELAKIRLLNGSHSALSYVAYLSEHKLVHEAMSDTVIEHFVRSYMSEIGRTVPAIEGLSLAQYQDQLVARYKNKQVRDTIERLNQDGSTKAANSLRPALSELLEQCVGPAALPRFVLFSVAAWMRYARGVDEHHQPIAVQDPIRDQLAAAAMRCIAQAPPDATEFCRLVLPELLQCQLAVHELQLMLAAIDRLGVRLALCQLTALA